MYKIQQKEGSVNPGPRSSESPQQKLHQVTNTVSELRWAVVGTERETVEKHRRTVTTL